MNSSDAERILPHNLEAERSVLGSILLHNEAFHQAAEVIYSKDFYRDAHRRIFDKMVKLAERGNAIDLVTLKEELGRSGDLDEVGGPAYITALVDGVPRSMNVQHYARIIRDKATKRQLIEEANKILEHSYAEDFPTAEIVTLATSRLAGIAAGADEAAKRRLHLTPASEITVRPVLWLWASRLALGTLGLLGGREGIGKSLVAYTLVGLLTRGRLPGVYFGTPRSVIIAATEDSWEHTIVPRLIAANADLTRVFRVDVTTSEGGALSLPRDLVELDHAIEQVSAAALILDPLMSRLDVHLDSHKDAEVRVALEPLVKLSEKRNCFTLGLIHVNKSTSGDALTTLMASRAFAAVARSVLYAMVDPDNEQIRLLGQIKNNLGRSDLSTLSFQIASYKVAETTEGAVWTGKLEWLGETDRSIKDAMVATAEMAGDKSAMAEAADWLCDYLTHKGGPVDSATVKRDGAKAGHSVDALKRARRKLQIAAINQGFPRQTFWSLTSQSEQTVGAAPLETALTTLTAPTGPKGPQSEQLEQSGALSTAIAPTGFHPDTRTLGTEAYERL